MRRTLLVALALVVPGLPFVASSPLMLHPTGDATADYLALSGTGNASAGNSCNYYASTLCLGGIALSGSGDATAGEECLGGPFSLCAASLAASGGGDATSNLFAASLLGSAEGGFVALSGRGAAKGGLVALSLEGPAEGFLAVSGTGNASGGLLAASGTGHAEGDFAVCGTRPFFCDDAPVVGVPVPRDAAVGPDADGDGLPADVEVRTLLVRLDPNTGAVEVQEGATVRARLDPDDGNASVPVPRVAAVPVPAGVRLGPDADRDGVPATVTVDTTVVVVDADAGTVTTLPGPPTTLLLDRNDADPNNPVPSVVSARAPTGVATPDGDGDGVPGALVLAFTTATLDRRDATLVLAPSGAQAVGVDPDDADPDTPVPRVVRAVAPTGATLGPDADGDGIPSELVLARALVSLDRTSGSATTSPADPQRVRLDPDDADPDDPAVSTVRARVPMGVALGPDGDRDGVPAAVTVLTTDVAFDRRSANLTLAPAAPQTARLDPDDADPDDPVASVFRAEVPTGAELGPDADGDGIPAWVRVASTSVALDRRDGSIATAAGPVRQLPLDPDDADADDPLPRRATAEVPSSAALSDEDGDGLPDRVTAQFTAVTVDAGAGTVTTAPGSARSVDLPRPPALPRPPSEAVATVPSGARLGPDADGDGFPAFVAVDFATVRVDLRNATVAVQPAPSLVQAVDPDDRDPNRPVPRPGPTTAPVPSGATLGPDRDLDGVPAYVQVDTTAVTVDPRTGNVTTAAGAPVRLGLDPNDNVPNPVGVALGDARGGTAALSVFGNASAGTVAASALGGASACQPQVQCLAVSGAGPASAYNAVSLAGDAQGCEGFDNVCVAASLLGDAAADDTAISVLGDATADDQALSVAGDAQAINPVSVLGQCNGGPCYALGAEGAAAHTAALALQGPAEALLAASGAGDAAGGLAGASALGDASGGLAAASLAGDAQGGLVAVSALGEASGPLSISGCEATPALCAG